MNENEATKFAKKYYNDEFARIVKNGERGWVFGPSILRAGFGGAILIVEKQSGFMYEIPSAYIGYYELALEDFENRQGLFVWPESGGVPRPNIEALYLRQIEDARKAIRSDRSQARYLADLLAVLARDVYVFKQGKLELADQHFREAVDLQRRYLDQWVPGVSDSPAERYVWFLKRQKREEEAAALEKEFLELRENRGNQPAGEKAKCPTPADDQLDYASQILEKAVDCEDAEQYERAIELYEEGISIIQKCARTEDTEFGLLLGYYGLGTLHFKRRDYLKAVGTFGRALTLYKSALVKEPLKFAIIGCAQQMAECLRKLGRKDELEELAEFDP